jgi:hypothetical protein
MAEPGRASPLPGHMALKHRPSLPSLLSSQRIKSPSSLSVSTPTASPAVPDNASVLSDVFTPVAELHADPLEDSVDSIGRRDEHLQQKLQEQLKRTLRRQASSSTVATRRSASKATREDGEEVDLPPFTRKYFVLTSAGKPVYARSV